MIKHWFRIPNYLKHLLEGTYNNSAQGKIKMNWFKHIYRDADWVKNQYLCVSLKARVHALQPSYAQVAVVSSIESIQTQKIMTPVKDVI